MEYLDTSRDLAAISFLPARVLRAASAIFRLPCSGNEGYHGSLAIRKPRTTCRSLGLPETAHDARATVATGLAQDGSARRRALAAERCQTTRRGKLGTVAYRPCRLQPVGWHALLHKHSDRENEQQTAFWRIFAVPRCAR